MTTDLFAALPGYTLAEWKSGDFSTWALTVPWRMSTFNTFSPGTQTLWLHNLGTGVFPNQTADPDLILSTGGVFEAVSPVIDLSKFDVNKWHLVVTVVFRPGRMRPENNKSYQPQEIQIWLDPGDGGASFHIDTLDNVLFEEENSITYDTPGVSQLKTMSEAALQASLDAGPGRTVRATEHCRVPGNVSNPEVGADGKWWFIQGAKPTEEALQGIVGKSAAKIRLVANLAQMDETGYGVGIDSVRMDLFRGKHVDTQLTYPVVFHRGYHARRW